ncbi:MAG TPA: cytochrome c peroxidase [Polyangiaceae bacterium]|jgi:cytochrome c peroxidase|nr:cytochrome c peroxidase [Polyangiaceae bacterium]
MTRWHRSWKAAATALVVVLALAALSSALRKKASASSRIPPGPSSVSSAAHPGLPGAGAGGAPSASPPAGEASAARIALGRAIFADASLSVPPGTSCASCHDPGRAFAGNHGSSLGVAAGSRPDHFAKRNTPSVLYLRFVRKFHLHWEEDAPLVDAYGGFFWDGRADSIAELIRQPLFNPDEMNAIDARHVAGAIAAGGYAADFRREFGGALDDPDRALRAVGEALEAYLRSPAMSPFSSKYDDYIRGRARLGATEMQGLRLFKDSAKGGCSACHKLNDRSPNPEASLFTDYGFDGVGVPRNRALPATRESAYFDLGLCERRDPDYKAKTEEFCGRFRAPSLRNVAVRERFMHNGYFKTLREVVAFYSTRSTNPERWYPQGAEFDDLPARYRDNVTIDKAPYNRHAGERPALDDGEIDAIVAFLGTLTDSQFRR